MKTKIWFCMKHDKHTTFELDNKITDVLDRMVKQGGLFLTDDGVHKFFVPTHRINGIEEVDA